MQPLPPVVRALPWLAAVLLALPFGLDLAGISIPSSLVLGSVIAGTGLLGYWIPLMAHRRHLRARELREKYRHARLER